jgi:tRNA modification GTPase
MRMEDTICALSTPQGMGAIAMIRVSGPETFSLLEQIFTGFSPRHNLSEAQPYQNIFGKIINNGKTVDEVMLSVYRGPNSYTGDDVAEIACHGSVYIQEQIIRLLLAKGVRLADPGEYTLRAFINGKMDLSQAEAVADLIASENKASHQVALQHMRGGFSKEIKGLREELIQFAALVELELDFGEEDVEFADRNKLEGLVNRIKTVLQRLIHSYDTGNVIKNGVSVVIVGAPNVGKSTLLNALLNEDRAIVSAVPGTTRDSIEDTIQLNGIGFRFIDTAGIRETKDEVESIGIARTFQKIEQSELILYLIDGSREEFKSHQALIQEELETLKLKCVDKKLLIVINKEDIADKRLIEKSLGQEDFLYIAAKEKQGLEELIAKLTQLFNWQELAASQTIVTNARHLQALQLSLDDIFRVIDGLNTNLSGDLLAFEIREALQHLGAIIGEVDVDKDILGAIFSKFCIGK